MPTTAVQQNVDTDAQVKFAPGDVVVLRQTGARGVIVEVDQIFCGPENAKTNLTWAKGPKRSPWYHVLVERESEAIYVSECQLDRDHSGSPISHPLIASVFTDFAKGRYIRLNH